MADARPLSLWLTDRSRYERGLDHCARDRYLHNHAGPHGYGWDRKAQSIPAVTGSLIHGPLAMLHEEMRLTDTLPTYASVYHAICEGVKEYESIVDQRGLRLVTDETDLLQQTREQTSLVEGLIWTYTRVALPQFHVEHRVVEVEVEDVTVYGCTCGLGDAIGAAEDHDARECRGIGWMTRADLIAQHRVTGSYSYHEFKTTADANMNWEAQWKYRTQMLAGVLGAEARLGVTIDAVYVHALIKGKRMSEYSQETKSYSGPKYQQSPLVCAYRRPANPPMLPEDWAIKFNYVDELGKARRLTKDYERTGIWALPESIWRGEAGGDCLSPLDYWTRLLAADGTLAQSYRVIGPIYREGWKLQSFITQLVAEERRWQTNLWALHLAQQRFESADFQRMLDTLIPQSRGSACRSYFGDSCSFLSICEREPGWDNPKLAGFLERRPHHQPEFDAMRARGLMPPEMGTGEGEGE